MDTLPEKDRNELVKKYFVLAVETGHVPSVDQMIKAIPHELATDLICQGFEREEVGELSTPVLITALHNPPLLELFLANGDKSRLVKALMAPCLMKNEYEGDSVFFDACVYNSQIHIRVFSSLLAFLGAENSYQALIKPQGGQSGLGEEDTTAVAKLIQEDNLPWIREAFKTIDESHDIDLIINPMLGNPGQAASCLGITAICDSVATLGYFLEFPDYRREIIAAMSIRSSKFLSPIECTIDLESIAALDLMVKEAAKDGVTLDLAPLVLLAANYGRPKILAAMLKDKSPSVVYDLITAQSKDSDGVAITPFELAVHSRRFPVVKVMLDYVDVNDVAKLFSKIHFWASASDSSIAYRKDFSGKSSLAELVKIAFLPLELFAKQGFHKLVDYYALQAFALAQKFCPGALIEERLRATQLLREVYENEAEHAKSSTSDSELRLEAKRAEASRTWGSSSGSSSSSSSSSTYFKRRRDETISEPPGQPRPVARATPSSSSFSKTG